MVRVRVRAVRLSVMGGGGGEGWVSRWVNSVGQGYVGLARCVNDQGDMLFQSTKTKNTKRSQPPNTNSPLVKPSPKERETSI